MQETRTAERAAGGAKGQAARADGRRGRQRSPFLPSSLPSLPPILFPLCMACSRKSRRLSAKPGLCIYKHHYITGATLHAFRRLSLPDDWSRPLSANEVDSLS